jgi:hypothetical protein
MEGWWYRTNRKTQHFSTESGMRTEMGTGFSINKRIISAVKGLSLLQIGCHT